MAHSLAIWGLALNAAGTLMLVFFPPTVSEYTEDGLNIPGGSPFSELPSSRYQQQDWKAAYFRRLWAFRLAFGLLTAGFVLQLIDLLLT